MNIPALRKLDTMLIVRTQNIGYTYIYVCYVCLVIYFLKQRMDDDDDDGCVSRIVWTTSKTRVSSTMFQKIQMIPKTKTRRAKTTISGGCLHQRFLQRAYLITQESSCSIRKIVWTKCSKQPWLSMLKLFQKWRSPRAISNPSPRLEPNNIYNHKIWSLS